MFSSGDDGVGAGDCLTNDGTNTRRFQPNFPASCPFVTTVSPMFITSGEHPHTRLCRLVLLQESIPRLQLASLVEDSPTTLLSLGIVLNTDLCATSHIISATSHQQSLHS